jgi:hypothetical protein
MHRDRAFAEESVKEDVMERDNLGDQMSDSEEFRWGMDTTAGAASGMRCRPDEDDDAQDDEEEYDLEDDEFEDDEFDDFDEAYEDDEFDDEFDEDEENEDFDETLDEEDM